MKKRLLDALTEIALEVGLTLLLLAIGFGAVRLFGGDLSLLDHDPDLLVLIGLGVLPVLALVVLAATRIVKRLIGRNRAVISEREESPDGESRGDDGTDIN